MSCPMKRENSSLPLSPSSIGLLILTCTILFGASTSLASPATATFRSLGQLPGGVASSASELSADGTVVVGTSYSMSGYQAFHWTENTGMVGLDLPLAESSKSRSIGVSADGSVVVGHRFSAAGWQVFKWTSETGMVGIDIDLPDDFYSFGTHGVSGDGAIIVGQSELLSGYGPVLWSEETGLVSLGGSGFHLSSANDVSADGHLVVGMADLPSGIQAFRWTQEIGMIGLGLLPGGSFFSDAVAISANGATVVGYCETRSGTEAFRWTEATGMVGLGQLTGGDYSSATDVSADGGIVVGNSHSHTLAGSTDEALYWNRSIGMQNLQDLLLVSGAKGLEDWQLQFAWAVSADGQTIVGEGINPSGQREAWIATLRLIPEPSTALASMAMGFGFLLRRARH